MPSKKIGFIGYRGHASRLIRIFDGLDGCGISHVYHPEKKIDAGEIPLKDRSGLAVTKDLDDLYSCDAIVICTPNHTHFSYLKKLIEGYKGYIFCEKPPVTEPEEVDELDMLPPVDRKRIYFNFNMRFSLLNDILMAYPEKYDLGQPIKASVTVGHGLGFKRSYGSNWRAKDELHKGGVFETLGIHHFDLFSSLYGAPKDFFCKSRTYSPYGNSLDTSHLSCSFDNGCFFNLTCSYCTPFLEEIELTYTNGYIQIDAKKVSVFGPRETFDKNGLFTTPPLIHSESIDLDLLYLESLKKSCSYFLDCVRSKAAVDIKHFDQSMLSNRMSLSVRKGKDR